jgi:hypothetical protein
MTDAPDVVQQLIAKWRDFSESSAVCAAECERTKRAEDARVYRKSEHHLNKCSDDLDHLHRTVLLPAIEALRRNVTMPDCVTPCEHPGDDCPICEGRRALAALDAPTGGEGNAK